MKRLLSTLDGHGDGMSGFEEDRALHQGKLVPLILRKGDGQAIDIDPPPALTLDLHDLDLLLANVPKYVALAPDVWITGWWLQFRLRTYLPNARQV